MGEAATPLGLGAWYDAEPRVARLWPGNPGLWDGIPLGFYERGRNPVGILEGNEAKTNIEKNISRDFEKIDCGTVRNG